MWRRLSDQELEDAIRLEVLRNRLGRPVNVTDSDISMDMLFLELFLEFFLDTPEEINVRMRNQSRPDGGDNNSVNMVDVTPKCKAGWKGWKVKYLITQLRKTAICQER